MAKKRSSDFTNDRFPMESYNELRRWLAKSERVNDCETGCVRV